MSGGYFCGHTDRIAEDLFASFRQGQSYTLEEIIDG